MNFIPTPLEVKNIKKYTRTEALHQEEEKIANYLIERMKQGILNGRYERGRIARNSGEEYEMLKRLSSLFEPKGWLIYINEKSMICYKEREGN